MKLHSNLQAGRAHLSLCVFITITSLFLVACGDNRTSAPEAGNESLDADTSGAEIGIYERGSGTGGGELGVNDPGGGDFGTRRNVGASPQGAVQQGQPTNQQGQGTAPRGN